MFNYVETAPVSIDRFATIALAEHIERVRRLGESLKRVRVIHVNSTAQGGGVAEILKSMVPMMDDSGPDSQWMVIEGNPEFFETTKRLHNLLQGADGSLTSNEFANYLDHNAKIAKQIEAQGESADVWVLHDPQTLPLVTFLPPGSTVIWVCQIDTTQPNQQVLQQLLPLMNQADRIVFSLPQYVAPGVDPDRVRIIPPAIDPLTPKNREQELDSIRPTLSRLGVDPDRPLITQAARFDYWKDPWGVIDAYRLVKKQIPEVQLALLGVIEALDDPEAFSVRDNVRAYAGEDPDIHLYSDLAQVGQPEVAAFQKGSDIVIQKSLREGFGLSVTEALWKGTPVIGGNCGGIRIQIEYGKNGYLVDTVEECAQRVLELLRDPKLGRWMGVAGRERVREHFLMPRLLADYLTVIKETLSSSTNGAAYGAVSAQPSVVSSLTTTGFWANYSQD